MIPESMLYLIHWIVNPLIILGLARALFGKARLISLPTVFTYSYLVLIYARALDVYLNAVHNLSFLLAVWLSPILFVVVCGFGLFLFNNPRPVGVVFRAFQSSRRDAFLAKVSPLLSACLVILPIVFVYDKGLKNIALLFLLSNPGAELETMLLRVAGLGSNISPLLTVLYSYGRALVYPTYVSVLIGLRANRLVSTAHVLLVLAAAAVFSALSAEKAPLAYLLAAVGFSLYLTYRGRINGRLVMTWFLALFLPALIYPLLYGSQGLAFVGVAIQSLWRRLTWVPSMTSALYFDLFPRVFEHVGWRSNQFLAAISGQEYVSVASIVYGHTYGTDVIAGGLVNTSYLASFYADWGWTGIILGTILVALVIASLERLFDRYQVDAVSVGIRARVLVAVAQLMLTSFYSVILGRGLLSLPILLVVLNVLFQTRKREPLASSSPTPSGNLGSVRP